MATDLAKYGIIPRKTGHEFLPIDEIPDNLIRHFIRGFFDGDGTYVFCSKYAYRKERKKYFE